MKHPSLLTSMAACAAALCVSTAAHAGAVTTWTVDSVVNGVTPAQGGTSFNTGAKNTGVQVQVGDTVVISTGANDRWNINSIQVTAAGYPNGYSNNGSHNHADITGFTELNDIDYGALAYSLDGLNWARAYDDSTLATNITFTATSAGSLRLAMWDTNVSDNGVGGIGSESNILTVTVDVTPGNDVPEPSALALVGLALTALGWSRRQRRQA